MVLMDSKELSDKEYTRDEHVTWEKDIRNIEIIFKNCIHSKYHEQRPDCSHIFSLLKHHMKDFQWQSLGDEYFRRFKLPMRMAFQSMAVLIYSTIMKRPWVNNRKDILDLYEQIKESYLESNKCFANVKERIKSEASWDVSLPEVCEMRSYLWQEFEQPACEKRWKNTELSSVVKDPTSKSNVLSNEQSSLSDHQLFSQTRKSSVEKEDEDDEDDDEEEDKWKNLSKENQLFFKTFASVKEADMMMSSGDNDKYIEMDIGGTANEFDYILKSRFKDLTKNEEIIVEKKEINLQATTKGEVIEDMITKAYKERSNYTEIRVNKWSRYMKNTFDQLNKFEQIFIENLQKVENNT